MARAALIALFAVAALEIGTGRALAQPMPQTLAFVAPAIPAAAPALAPPAFATPAPAPAAPAPATLVPSSSPDPDPDAIDPAMAARILALDPERLTARDVREVLATAPAPRLILLQGSLAFVTMEPFAEYLVAMGYPEQRIRNPRDGALSYGSFGSSEVLAGTLAWYYERERMMPLLIGHSQGGMLAVRTLHELAGAFSETVHVVDPRTGEALPRTTIVDPHTRIERPVVGLTLPYAAAIATGKLPRLLLGQWSMIPRLRKIPDTAAEFTGFSFDFDPIAGEFGGAEPYVATGTAHVRNVTLPSAYSHIDLPNTLHLAADAGTRAWIDAYFPGTTVPPPSAPGEDTTNLLHAADIWYSVRRAWCLAAQQLVREHLARAAQ